MKLTELIEKRIDENVASYDLGTLESYKYLIEMIAIEYHNEQLNLSGVSHRREQLLKSQSDYLMLNTQLTIEQIVDFTEVYKNF